MKRIWIAGSVALLTVLGLVVAVAGQDGLAGLVQPFVVDIEQAVPAEVTLAVPVEDGQIMTVTAPITVQVGLRVAIDGPQVVTVEPLPSEETRVTVNALAAQGEPLVDENGLEYQIEIPEGIEIIQLRVGEDSSEDFLAIGELRNLSDETLESAEFVFTLYDSEGNLGSVETGYMTLDEVPPGGTSPFRVMTYTPAEFIGSYLIQIETRFDD